MHLLSCEHPKRIFNKYTKEYIWVPCGKCNTCKNRRASAWVSRLESERSQSEYTFFVTLTYENDYLPIATVDYNFDVNGVYKVEICKKDDPDLVHTFSFDEFFEEECDWKLFDGLTTLYHGLPYASVRDVQLFNKRLNKYFYERTNKFKNFRYFIVSEFGSTTFRPHYHAIYFCNDSKVAESFAEGIRVCWSVKGHQIGRVDTQLVEKSACSYCAQYINKLTAMPSFYKTPEFRPWYIFSKSPTIGADKEYRQSDSGDVQYDTENLSKVFHDCPVTRVVAKKGDTSKLDCVTLDPSLENRLFPKCFSFKQISHTLRVELYSITSRFPTYGKQCFRDFLRRVRAKLYQVFDSVYKDTEYQSNLLLMLRQVFYLPYKYGSKDLQKSAVEWLRRLYYLSRKIERQAYDFGVSVTDYVSQIEKYWNKKELYLLGKFYEFQSEYSRLETSEHLLLCYPEYLYVNGIGLDDFIHDYEPKDYLNMVKDSKYLAFSNKSTHFKNMYLESLKEKGSLLFNVLINYYNAKKCNEIIEAFAS